MTTHNVRPLFVLAALLVAVSCGGPLGRDPFSFYAGPRVVPVAVTLAPGATAQMAFQSYPGDGGDAVTLSTATWTSSAAAVATVSSTGLVTAVATGTATITGTAGGASATATVEVPAPPPPPDAGPGDGGP